MIGHNQVSFDQIVEENLLRGIYLSQLNALSRCVRDPRMSSRHCQVLATIIERTNSKTGMAYPGRAKLAEDIVYYVNGEPQRYSEASIAKAIVELIECGYLLVDKRAPEKGGRALSHYTTVAPAVEDLQAEISIWCAKIRGQGRKFPATAAHTTKADGDTGVVVRQADGDTSVNVDARITVTADGDTGVQADGDTGIPTVTGIDLTGNKMGGPSTEDDFEVFWKAFPDGRKRAKGATLIAFRKIVAGSHRVGKASPADLIIAAKRYAATKPDPDYTPMPTTWLNEGRWMDDMPDTPASAWWQDPEKVKTMDDARWLKGIRDNAKDFWPIGVLGPPPGHLECKVPRHLIQELRLTETYTPGGMRR